MDAIEKFFRDPTVRRVMLTIVLLVAERLLGGDDRADGHSRRTAGKGVQLLG